MRLVFGEKRGRADGPSSAARPMREHSPVSPTAIENLPEGDGIKRKRAELSGRAGGGVNIEHLVGRASSFLGLLASRSIKLALI